MFIWDFVADKVLGGIIDWIYEKILDTLGEFFGLMGNMGAEIFDYNWVKSIVEIMRLFGWTLFAVGLVVAAFECALEYQGGRGSIKDTALNYIKGFMAVSLFTVVPISLFKFCITLQVQLTSGMATLVGSDSIGETAKMSLGFLTDMGLSALLAIMILIMMGYSIIKIFFANLKRGGILLITIAVGSLYMFSVPRGYTDGFVQWCKQIIGICLTADVNCRTWCHERKLFIGNWFDPLCRRDTKNCWTVWNGHKYESESDEYDVCCTSSYVYYQNDCRCG